MSAPNANQLKNNNPKKTTANINNTDFTVLISNPKFANESGLEIAIYNQTITNNKNNQKKIPHPTANVLNDILLPCFATIWGVATGWTEAGVHDDWADPDCIEEFQVCIDRVWLGVLEEACNLVLLSCVNVSIETWPGQEGIGVVVEDLEFLGLKKGSTEVLVWLVATAMGKKN